MKRKNYLIEELSNEEKLYLKKCVITARNQYARNNDDFLNIKLYELKEEIGVSEDVIFTSVFENLKKQYSTVDQFQQTIENPILYTNIKALSFSERTVLFYLFWKRKTINETASIMKIHRTTVIRHRDDAVIKLFENIVGGNRNV